MKSEVRSQAFLRRRKMFLVLPLLALPFVTLAFWALGGGRGLGPNNSQEAAGLNLNLPSSNQKRNSAENKLSFYDKAAKDSAKLEEWMRNDPYYRHRSDTAQRVAQLEGLTANTASTFKQQLNPTPYDGAEQGTEQKLMQKLSQLQAELNKPETVKKPAPLKQGTSEKETISADIDRLETMMQGMNGEGAEDPEMHQLSTTLDKILDIQHPDRVKDRLKEKSVLQKETVFPISKKVSSGSIGLLGSSKTKTAINFYGLHDAQKAQADDNAVEALIAANQSIVSGAVVQMRLVSDVVVNGRVVPNGSFINGIASLNNERLSIDVKTLKSGNSILPVRLTVYDLDGLEGIYIPGAISRDAAKQAVDNNLQLLELSTLDPSLKAQAASAGISAAKNLVSRKVKQVRVSLKTGYRVLLKNNDN